MLNGSVIQSTSNGNSNGMRMMRSQAAMAPDGSTTGSLFSNDALSSFAGASPGATTNFNNNANPNNQVITPATAYGGAPYSNPVSQGQTNQSNQQTESSQFDLGKAISIGTTMLHGFNQLVSATRPPAYAFNGSNQMTNSLMNQSNLQASLPGGAAPFLNGSAGASSFAGSASQLFTIGRPLNRNEVNLLSNYDVAVIIDKSGSMQTQDCPGGLSRWDFCREQLLNLTSQAGSAFRSGITVALFSSDYRIFNNVNFAAVPAIFEANYPDGGTYLANPLKEILSTYFAQRDRNRAGQVPTRPLLVEIITDGEPSDKGALIRVICDATQKMTSGREVNIQFLQIGHDNEGGRVLNELQTRLVPDDGAQYGIVNVEPFQAVLNEGLARSMVSVASAH
jgi:uncharacterized protein YegL